jgi:integrase
LWNKASQSITGWPALEIPVPSASRRYALEWSEFPASFTADVEAFLGHAGDQSVLADDYAPSVRPATILVRRKTLRQMATALASSGFPIANIIGLATLVQSDNAKKVLQFFLDRPRVGNESVYGHAILLRTIARHWVPRDEENIRRLETFCKSLTPKKNGMTVKNRGRLRQFDEPRNVVALLDLPANLLRQSQREDVGGREHLVGVVYALAIELLTVVPMRIKNLTTLEVERHFIRSDRGALPVFHLVIPGEEVKNGTAIEVQLPKRSTELLMLYLKTYRPRLCSVPSPWLFPNAAGQQRNITGFGHHIGQLIHRHTGLKMNHHLFRHLSGKFILDAHPDAIETVRLLLGHTSTRTTLRAYAEGRNAPAFKRLESVIDAKRNEALGRRSKKRVMKVGA